MVQCFQACLDSNEYQLAVVYRLIVELDKTNRHVAPEICQFMPFLMVKSQIDQTKQKRESKKRHKTIGSK